MSNSYRCTPRQARKLIEQIIEARLVPNLQSSPGMGKSSIYKLVANNFRLWMVDHRLSSSDPTDINGFPYIVNGRATFVPFDLFPVEGTPIPEGHDGWMLFLDEMNSAAKSVQAAAYKLILDKMVGQHRLHSNVVLAATGNLATDRAITNPISTAMQSRMVHLEMEVNFQEWLEDVAIPERYDSRVIAFLNQYPSKLMDFRPDHQERTFCCPRTWEFTNRLIQGRELDKDSTILLSGTITSGVAVEFVQFCKLIKDMLTVADIRKDPKNCPLPKDISTQWAVITSMMDKLTDENFKDLATYANRFDMPFRVLFYRYIPIRHPNLKTHPSFIGALQDLTRFLHAA